MQGMDPMKSAGVAGRRVRALTARWSQGPPQCPPPPPQLVRNHGSHRRRGPTCARASLPCAAAPPSTRRGV